MSENHIGEHVPEADSNGVSESNTDSNQDQVESVDLKDGVLGDHEDGKSTEDNMFVDCPDELITFDGRQKDEEAAAAETDDAESEGNRVSLQRQNHFVELRNGVGDGYLTDQLEQLRHSLEKAVVEKENIVQEYQEERETVAQGVLDLHSQLKALTGKQSGAEAREVADVPIREMIKECLEFVKTASEENPNSETAISNLHELMSVKDREIDDLNAKLAKLTVSNESLQVSSQAQLEKDRNIEIVIDKTISSLATVFNQEQVLDDSISRKIVYIEEGTTLLIEKYNQVLSEIYQLGQSLSEVGFGIREQEYGTILADARGGLLELKRKEAELVEKLVQLEDGNRKLVEELDKERATIETLNTEVGNMKTELEQEKVKSANTKEKLSMAVTKGKALVQQRDSLKVSLAEKSSELEKCLIELQEKSVALEAAKHAEEELAQSGNVVASLQNSLLQNKTTLDQVEEILSHAEPDQHEMFDMPERLRWLVDDRKALKGAFLELCKLKEALSVVDLPEELVSSSDLESQMNWLAKSFRKTQDDVHILQEEISTIKEVSRDSIDWLSISFLLELQEKDYLQSELTDLTFKYEELVNKNHQISLEKDQIVNMLVDLCGLNMEDHGIDRFSSSTSTIIDACFQIIKGQSGPFSRASHIDAEWFERIQSLLYVKDQGLMLYEDILEEELLIRSDVNRLSNELKVASEEIIALKEERSTLLKDLERSEEKNAMVREKLSMAVKKGKGLVQDRDNLKGLLNEKNSEIEQLKADLQKKEIAVSEYRDEINRLSSDLESIPKLEADLLEMKSQRNQFEQFLMESNNMLQRVIECIDGIVLPVDPDFGEPVEKVKWFAGYVSECQDAKVHLEQELQLIKEEASTLEINLAEACATVKSLEQGLSSSEDRVSQLAEEKTELEHGKAKVEEELLEVKEKFAEVFSTTKSLEDALEKAEKEISVLSQEKEQAQADKVAAAAELESIKDEAARLTGKLEEASRTIEDLEDKLSQVESNANSMNEKYNAYQVVKVGLENELKKLQDEAATHTSKLLDASATIKSMEDALLKAQEDISSLEDANKIAKEEISSLGFKLNSCMDELAGKNGSLENRSLELIGLLTDLKVLMRDNTLFPRIKQCFEKKCETLKNMDLILTKISDHVTMIVKDSEGHHVPEENPLMRKAFLDDLENFGVELDDREINSADIDSIISSSGKITKEFQLRNQRIADKFDEFSDCVDDFISALHEKLLETETNTVTIGEHMEVMKEKVDTLEKLKAEKENIIATLENDISVLLSACADSTNALQNEVDNYHGQQGSVSDVEISNLEVGTQAEHYKNGKYVETTQKLINASSKAQNLIRQFESRSKQIEATVEGLQNKLKETTDAFEFVREERDSNKNRILLLESDIQSLQCFCTELKESRSKQIEATVEDLQNKLKERTDAFEFVREERDLNKNRVLQLESDIQSLQHVCAELKDKWEGYHTLEEKFKAKEAEISSMHNALLAKEESSFFSESQMRDLFDKVDRIKIPILESEEDDMEPHTSAPVEKLFYVIDSVTRLQDHINSLSHDKAKMQSILETQVLEIKDLKEEVKQLYRNCEDSKMVKNELTELTFVLEKVMDLLGASEWILDRKSKGLKELIPALERHIITILSESENSKSKAQELGVKLVGSQKVIDELTTKVKLLEDSLQDRTSQPDIVQERSIFEASSLPSGSEITEVEEGPLGKKAISPVPSAAHVRNMRKGSTDHLALDINVESDHLISRADTDDDKGHVFKSLNTSGFVPKQGKQIADRIDGIWVSGSRVLMNRPRARLGLIGYLFIMHIWLLGTIL